MANEPLIIDLQALHEEYKQRQKAANSALTAAKKDAGTLKNVLSALNAVPIDVVKLGKVLTDLRKLNGSDQRISDLYPALAAELKQAQDTLSVEFGMLLREGFAAQGIDVGGTSGLEIGRFAVVVDFETRKAAIDYGKENVIPKKVTLNVEAVSKAYQTALKLIEGREENADLWLEQLYTAWTTVRKAKNLSGSRANIVDCYFEVVMLRQRRQFFSAPSKSGFVDYTRAQFAYDLYELAIRPQRRIKGLTVAVHSAAKAQNTPALSLYLVEGAFANSGRFIGDLEFESAANR